MHHKAKGLKNNASPLQLMSYNKVYIFTQNKKQETTQNPSLKTIIYNKHAILQIYLESIQKISYKKLYSKVI